MRKKKSPQSTASTQIENKDHDDTLNKLLDRINSIIAQKTPFKRTSLPPGIANQLYNILIKENSDWKLDKKATRKRLVQLYKDRQPKDLPPKDFRPRKLFQDFIQQDKINTVEDAVPLGSILSPGSISDSDESVPNNSLMKTYTKVMKSLSNHPQTRRQTRSSSEENVFL